MAALNTFDIHEKLDAIFIRNTEFYLKLDYILWLDFVKNNKMLFVSILNLLSSLQKPTKE